MSVSSTLELLKKFRKQKKSIKASLVKLLRPVLCVRREAWQRINEMGRLWYDISGDKLQ